jgi:hypothetical protein
MQSLIITPQIYIILENLHLCLNHKCLQVKVCKIIGNCKNNLQSILLLKMKISK